MVHVCLSRCKLYIALNYDIYLSIPIEDTIDMASKNLYRKEIIETGKYRDSSKWGGLTLDQLKSSPLRSLIHGTTLESLYTIVQHGELRSRMELYKSNTTVSGGLSGPYPEEKT